MMMLVKTKKKQIYYLPLLRLTNRNKWHELNTEHNDNEPGFEHDTNKIIFLDWERESYS
jgi:hypothetical protein